MFGKEYIGGHTKNEPIRSIQHSDPFVLTAQDLVGICVCVVQVFFSVKLRQCRPPVLSGVSAAQWSDITISNANNFQATGDSSFQNGAALLNFPSLNSLTVAPATFSIDCTGCVWLSHTNISIHSHMYKFVDNSCAGANITFLVKDCMGYDPLTIAGINCIGDGACEDTTIDLGNYDPNCTLNVESLVCGDGTNTNDCDGLTILSSGAVNIQACTCNLDPQFGGFCTYLTSANTTFEEAVLCLGTQNPSKNPTQSQTENPTKNPSKNPQNPPNNPWQICSAEDIGFMNTTYKIWLRHRVCNDSILQFISDFIDIIDTTYSNNNLIAKSNITSADFQTYSHFEGEKTCGDITLNVLTCFSENINQLLCVTKSTDFIKDINDEIEPMYNNTLISIINTTVTYITYNETDPVKLWMFIVVVAVCFCVLVTAMLLIKRKYKLARIKKQMVINNAMVLCVGIGRYDENPKKADALLQNSSVNDLELEQDIDNLYGLFGSDCLNYAIHPKAKRVEWTLKQLIRFLSEQAKKLHQNLTDDAIDSKQKFDGLFVAVSSHGFDNAIITSDYKLIDKDAIHRIFSRNYPMSRSVLFSIFFSVFIFHSCTVSILSKDAYFYLIAVMAVNNTKMSLGTRHNLMKRLKKTVWTWMVKVWLKYQQTHVL